MENIKFIDLFAGLGGFREALQSLENKKGITTECVFVSEINENVKMTYRHNFSHNSDFINIKDISENCAEVPDHDFLFAGFPCQTFSNAGNKRGFLDDIRGTLFFDIAKILKNKKPKYALLENVKHIVNHDNGDTWKKILKTLSDLGYIYPEKPLILNPINFGVPQDRSRVFIPLVLKEKILTNDKYLVINFDSLENKKFNNKNDYKKLKKLIFKEFLEKKVDGKYYLTSAKNANGQYINNVLEAWGEFLLNVKKGNKYTLPVIWLEYINIRTDTEGMPAWKINYLNKMWNIYDLNKEFIDEWMIKWDVKSWKSREKKFEWQAGIDIKDIKESFIQLRQSGIRCRRPTSFPTLVAMVQIPIVYELKKGWRYLTPRETANLQSYPKKYKLFNELKIENSNSDFFSYMQIGNSVNIKIVEMIQTYLLENY